MRGEEGGGGEGGGQDVKERGGMVANSPHYHLKKEKERERTRGFAVYRATMK